MFRSSSNFRSWDSVASGFRYDNGRCYPRLYTAMLRVMMKIMRKIVMIVLLIVEMKDYTSHALSRIDAITILSVINRFLDYY